MPAQPICGVATHYQDIYPLFDYVAGGAALQVLVPGRGTGGNCVEGPCFDRIMKLERESFLPLSPFPGKTHGSETIMRRLLP